MYIYTSHILSYNLCLILLLFTVLLLLLFSDRCDNPNEEFSGCRNNCTESCAARTSQVTCPTVCRSGCFCVSGYARNPAGNCVMLNQCPGKLGFYN